MFSLCSKCNLSDERRSQLTSVGLLILRLYAGGMMFFAHGLGKFQSFGEKSSMFPDPLGVGSPLSMGMAIGAEVFCSLAIILGLATRAAALPLIVTMLVAAFIIHGDDPWAKKEFALMHLLPYLVLLFTGAGAYSLDARCKNRCKLEEE